MNNPLKSIDPMALQAAMWPQYTFYQQQRDVIYSVDNNLETYVRAGNKLGKDFTAGYIVTEIFLRCIKLGLTCKIITTSVNEKHLTTLWGEIGRFVTTSKYPLLRSKDKAETECLVMLSMEIRRAEEEAMTAKNVRNFIRGMVSEDVEGMSGHHADFTLFVGDEASGLEDMYYEAAQGWAKRMLLFGNPNACTWFFYKNIKAGDVKSEDGTYFLRKNLKISAEDSPNVMYARRQQALGLVPDDKIIVPGVISWSEYQNRRTIWDKARQCVGLDGEFYEGASIKMFPYDWMQRAEIMSELIRLKRLKGTKLSLGADPAEGGDKTAVVVVDEYGVVDWEYGQTPDTSKIKGLILFYMNKHSIPASRVCIDRGGGGKQIADELRDKGHDVQTVSFGESCTPKIKDDRAITEYEEKIEAKEERYTYKNRRAQMYMALRLLLDPYEGIAVELPEEENEEGRPVSTRQTFGIPREFSAVREELEPIPLTRDGEGIVYLLPKNKPRPDYKGDTLTSLIGHSPDLADALVLAIYAMQHEEEVFMAGQW